MRFCGTEGYNIWTLKWVFVLLTFVDNKNCRKWLLLLFCLSFPFSILYKSISTPLIDLYSFFALEYIITQVTWISWSLLCLFLCTQRDTLSPPIVYIHTHTHLSCLKLPGMHIWSSLPFHRHATYTLFKFLFCSDKTSDWTEAQISEQFVCVYLQYI